MSLDAGRVGVRADQVDVHGRVTSPSFLNELLEDLPEWTDMPVWVNGTEELLPSDNSVPVTSPTLADIAYPDIIRDNQYFTYRESPTPVDGLAKIKSIKGNTLKWNQLIYNGNFTSTDGWAGQSDNPTLSVADNAITVTMTSGSPSVFNPAIKPSSQYPFVVNHKYLFSFDLKATKAGVCLFLRANAFGGGLNFFPVLQSANTWTSYKNIVTATNAENVAGYFGLSYGSDSGFTVGDSFSLRNLMMIDLTALGIADKTNAEILQWFADYFPLNYYSYNAGTLLSFNGTGIKTANEDESQEHTTTLPISTYFPTGMKSAGSVYDELTPTKAVTRIGAVDLGSLTWNGWEENGSYIFYATITDKKVGRTNPCICLMYEYNSNVYTWADLQNKQMTGSLQNSTVYIRDSSYTDVATFKTAMSGIYLFYELATPVELPTLSLGE